MKKSNFLCGRFWGGALLVAGCCIGAGMLALPIVTGLCGFFPSMILFFVSWAFMTFTGLLMVEINGWFSSQVNIVSMAEVTFGFKGRCVAWVLYLLLFYSLLVAYVSGGGNVLSSILDLSSWKWQAFSLFAFLIAIVYCGTRPVDLINRLFMVGLIACYFIMISLGISFIKISHLFHVQMKYILLPLPILITSFGFHNMVPSLTAYMKGDLAKVRATILCGSLLVLFVYFFWELLVLGAVPFEGPFGIQESFSQGKEASYALKNSLGIKRITLFSDGFSLFAIITSFLAVSLGLVHFIADGIKSKKVDRNFSILLVALLPSLILGLTFSRIFFFALSFAGGVCAVTLFGILPVLMVWKGRYLKKFPTSYHVRGGKFSLIICLLFSLFILALEVTRIIKSIL